ncbi:MULTISPECIES: ESX-1 secretion-associated protein [unclassified Mycobacterium]|uniref:ESX-1 secretion-associated protein n=1 Tax=unclassified Mycobacterium TaxID=2642494 RepID=UPI0029C77E02|nr:MULTISPECIES: ESX-1 secretion-associated protein [unclassified Mycobacterium]
MSTELRVLVAHLGELAAKQGEAAAVIGSATDAVNGVGAWVASTHGTISSSTAAAVAAVEHARRTAGGKLERESRKTQHRLTQSAANYELTDREVGGRVTRQMRPS